MWMWVTIRYSSVVGRDPYDSAVKLAGVTAVIVSVHLPRMTAPLTPSGVFRSIILRVNHTAKRATGSVENLHDCTPRYGSDELSTGSRVRQGRLCGDLLRHSGKL